MRLRFVMLLPGPLYVPYEIHQRSSAFISGPWLLISGLVLSHAPLCLRDTKPPR